MIFDFGLAGYSVAWKTTTYTEIFRRFFGQYRLIKRDSTRDRRIGETEAEQRFIPLPQFEERLERGEYIPETFRKHYNRLTGGTYFTAVEIPELWLPPTPEQILTFYSCGSAVLDIKSLFCPTMATVLLVVSQGEAEKRTGNRKAFPKSYDFAGHLETNKSYDDMDLKRYYDCWVDTTRMTPQQVVERVETIITTLSGIKPKNYVSTP